VGVGLGIGGTVAVWLGSGVSVRTDSETSAGILQLAMKEASSNPEKRDFKFMFTTIPERPLTVNIIDF